MKGIKDGLAVIVAGSGVWRDLYFHICALVERRAPRYLWSPGPFPSLRCGFDFFLTRQQGRGNSHHSVAAFGGGFFRLPVAPPPASAPSV